MNRNHVSWRPVPPFSCRSWRRRPLRGTNSSPSWKTSSTIWMNTGACRVTRARNRRGEFARFFYVLLDIREWGNLHGELVNHAAGNGIKMSFEPGDECLDTWTFQARNRIGCVRRVLLTLAVCSIADRRRTGANHFTSNRPGIATVPCDLLKREKNFFDFFFFCICVCVEYIGRLERLNRVKFQSATTNDFIGQRRIKC